MFEHLDDPAGFAPDPPLRDAVVARGRRRQAVRRMVVAATGVALVAVLVGAASTLYVARRDAAIDRVDVATEPSTGGATNILLIGTDVRPDAAQPCRAAAPDCPRDVGGTRADTIAVVRVEADGSIKVLSIPRDLVDPATGQRLASTRDADDGPDAGRRALLDAVRRLTAVEINHFVEVDLAGFVALVDELGGLRLAVDVPLRDAPTGLDLPPSPCATLDGETALALVRARHVEGDPWSDISRMARTQVLLAAVAQLRDVGSDPREADRLSRILADHAVVDDGLTLERMVGLGRAMAAGPGVVYGATLPIEGADDSSTLEVASDARAVLQDFGVPAHDPDGAGAGAGDGGAGLPTDVPTGIRPC